MALGLLAAGAGAALSGAGGQLGRDKSKETLEYAPEQKPFMRAAQAQIPLYLQTMTGGMPDFLRRYLMQTQGALQQQMGQGAQDYLRQMGMRGMDFGPSAQAGLSNIYSSAIPALAQGLTQTRGDIMGKAMGAMQQWSAMTPQKMLRTKQPSVGRAAAAGALQGFGRGMGAPARPKQQLAGRAPNVQAAPQQAPLAQNTTLGGGQRFNPAMLKQLLGGAGGMGGLG